MSYQDNLSSDQADAIFLAEGGEWIDGGFSEIFVSKGTHRHLAAVWDCDTFWTWRIGGANCEAVCRAHAKQCVEERLNGAERRRPKASGEERRAPAELAGGDDPARAASAGEKIESK